MCALSPPDVAFVQLFIGVSIWQNQAGGGPAARFVHLEANLILEFLQIKKWCKIICTTFIFLFFIFWICFFYFSNSYALAMQLHLQK
jgi:hypothetical protein